METGSERGQAAQGFRGRPSHCQAQPFLQDPPAPRRPPPGSAPLPTMVAGGHWEQTQTLCLFWKTAEGGTAASADGRGGARMPAPTFPNVPSPLHGGGGSPRGSRGLSAETGPPAWSLCPGASCLLCHWAPTLPGWASLGRPGAHSRPHSLPREASPCLPPRRSGALRWPTVPTAVLLCKRAGSFPACRPQPHQPSY